MAAAIERACKLFGAKYANVQPHSGAQANLAVYFALLDLGDTVMGMDLSQGGHLTHGSPVNMSGKNYNFVSYGVNADGVIDYAELEKQVRKVRPKLIVAGASAYPRAIDFEKIAEIAHGYGAYLMVDMAHIAGLVAGGYHQSPVPYADVVTTTTHKTLRGPRGGMILCNKEANEKFEKDFRALMAQLHQFDPTDTNAIGMWNTAESFRMMNNIMNGIALFIWVVGIGTLIAGIVGVSNIMLITVRERTKEFGIRKAIGAKPSSILRLIITESILVTAVFGYIGMLGGIGLTELINSGMEAAGVGENPGQGGTIFLNPTVNLSIALASTLLIVIAGVLAGYFPARKAVSISAIEAMRTE